MAVPVPDADPRSLDHLVLEALAVERTRFADALHDGALQELAALRQDVAGAIDGDVPSLPDLEGRLERLGTELRGLAGALHEPSLEDASLDIALERVAERHRLRGRLEIAIDVQDPAIAFSDPLLREAVRELLANVEQHARATTVTVSVDVRDDLLELRVADDGTGFDPAAAARARHDGHLGLARLERLAGMLGGRLAMASGAAGGTVARVLVPTAGLVRRGLGNLESATGLMGDRRGQTADTVIRAAKQRDAVDHSADLRAQARDRRADERDLQGARQDDIVDDVERRAKAPRPGHRARARTRHALDESRREAGRSDRASAGIDRERAAFGRLEADADRAALADALSVTENDPLTGTRARAAGLTELEAEIDRCERTLRPLTVAYVDVIGLKAVNDADGHGAGDELLQRVTDAIRERLRSYDLLVRVGGDEFLCVMPDMSCAAAERRFAAVNAALGARPSAAVAVGYALHAAGETGAVLVDRADADLLRRRQTRGAAS